MPFSLLLMCNFFPLGKNKKKSSLVQFTYKKSDIEREDGRKSESFLTICDSSQTAHISITSILSVTNLPNLLTVAKIFMSSKTQTEYLNQQKKSVHI